MAKRKVLVSGYYGFGNTGDEAILLALKEALKKEDVELIFNEHPKNTLSSIPFNADSNLLSR